MTLCVSCTIRQVVSNSVHFLPTYSGLMLLNFYIVTVFLSTANMFTNVRGSLCKAAYSGARWHSLLIPQPAHGT